MSDEHADALPSWLTDDEDPAELPWLAPTYLRRDEDSGVIDTTAPQLDRGSEEHGDWMARAFPAADALPDDGRTWFVASTDVEARDGHIFEQQWRLAEWRRNPVILAEHQPSVIGRGVARTVKGDDISGLLVGVEWHRSELNPLGMLIAEQHDTGFRKAVSVRMIPGQAVNRSKLPEGDPRRQNVEAWRAGMVFRFPVLLEVSSVAVPSDARAIQIRSWVHEVEDPTQQLARLLRETAGPDAREVIRAAVRDVPELRRALLGTIPMGPAPANPVPADLPAFMEG